MTYNFLLFIDCTMKHSILFLFESLLVVADLFWKMKTLVDIVLRDKVYVSLEFCHANILSPHPCGPSVTIILALTVRSNNFGWWLEVKLVINEKQIPRVIKIPYILIRMPSQLFLAFSMTYFMDFNLSWGIVEVWRIIAFMICVLEGKEKEEETNSYEHEALEFSTIYKDDRQVRGKKITTTT